MRLLALSIEFSRDVFSGNGVYCNSQIRALSALGHEVLVVCGRPAAPRQVEPHTAGAAAVIEVPLPTWGHLDAGCAWREFAEGAGAPDTAAAVVAFRPTAVLCVDWHSVPAFERLAEQLRVAGAPVPPFVFLNYRIYLRTCEDHHRDTIFQLEQRALELACLATVLSQSDAHYLAEHLVPAPAPAPGPALPPVHVLLPALRGDMEALPLPADAAPVDAAAGASAAGGSTSERQRQPAGQQQAPPQRRYLSCCVRLSPEKQADRFVDLVYELHRRGALARLGVQPLMLGAGWDSAYGQEQRRRVLEMVPQTQVIEAFMGPADLAQVYSQTLLNVHPCTYDAYGMTVVEAGSQGAPSLVQAGGSVGATDLLSAAHGEVLTCDWEQPVTALADTVEALLADRPRLAEVGRRAAAKARSWTEQANAEALMALVQAAVDAKAGA